MLLLLTAEALIIYAGFIAAKALLTGLPPAQWAHAEMLASTAAALLFMTLMGLYEPDRINALEGRAQLLLRILFGLVLAALALVAINAFTLATLLEAVPAALGLGLALPALVAERLVQHSIVRSPRFKRRILVLGTGTRAHMIEHHPPTRNGGDLPYHVVGYVAPEGETAQDVPPDRLLRMNPGQSLLDLVRARRADQLVVAIRDRRGKLPIRDLLECKLHGVPICDISGFFEREFQQLRLDSLNTSWMVFGDGFRRNWRRNAVKRALDLTASSALLIVTLPVMLATAIAIRLDSPGPVFYWQTRVGMGNRPFEICKFRSMRQDAERNGEAQWATSDDDRVTRVGRVIRKLRIDELPQIINVFRGEMSFVGPRPERPVFVEQLSQQIPFFLARHSLRPGITGWAQVCYPYGASVQDAKEKLQYDLYYVKNHTLFLDTVILLETVKVVLFGRGAR